MGKWFPMTDNHSTLNTEKLMEPPIQNTPSCQDTVDRSISMPEALRLIEERMGPVRGRESLALRDALGRTLAEPVISPMNVPAHRNSAMDGYALAGTELPEQGSRELRVVGTAYAGRPFQEGIGAGECVRIMTGAKMPDETDTVVIQERVELNGETIRIDADNKPGQNLRQAGEDIATGSTLLATGRTIGPAQLGLLASLGIPEVAVRRRVRVAFFSSGDEVKSIGEPLAEGEIYDSNRFTLYGMLTRLGADVLDMGVIPDRQETITNALQEAAGMADLVLTSGGVSVGEADYITGALRETGEIHFSKVAIKPGRPLTFGNIGNSRFFGLPGNPVAVMITFLQFVRPALKRMMGEESVFTPSFRVPCRSPLRKLPGRTEFQRGILEPSDDGVWQVRTTGRQGSGVLSSMSTGNCFILLPDDAGNVAPDDLVKVQPFSQFFE